jgi:biotin operon repressor
VTTPTQNVNPLEQHWRPLTEKDIETDPPPRRWIVKPYLAERKVAHLSGLGGGGKSTLIAKLGVSRALGEAFFGCETKPGCTLLVTLEELVEDYRRKIAALRRIAQSAAAPWNSALVAKRFPILSLRGADFCLVAHDHGQPKIVSGHVENLAALIKSRCPDTDLVVLETLSRLTGAVETNATNSAAVRAAELLSRLLGDIAILLVGHVSQDAARAGTTDQHAGRGGTALGDDARSTLVLARLTEKNQGEFPGANVWSRATETERKTLYVLTHPKANGPTADPMLLERRWEQTTDDVFFVQRNPTASCNSTVGAGAPGQAVPPSRLADYERLRAFVESEQAKGKDVTQRSLRDVHERFGLGETPMRKLIANAVVDGLLIEDGTRKVKSGHPLRVGPQWAHGPTGTAADRIVRLLQTKEPPNQLQIAEDLELPEKTVEREIGNLVQAGAVLTPQGERGYRLAPRADSDGAPKNGVQERGR